MSAARLEELSELTWEKETLVAGPLHEGVGGVPVGLHPGEPHLPALVLLLPDVLHHLDPLLPTLDHDPVQVLHMEGNILHPVPVISQVSAHLLTHGRARLVGGLEDKEGVLLPDNVSRHLAGASLQTLQKHRQQKVGIFGKYFTPGTQMAQNRTWHSSERPPAWHFPPTTQCGRTLEICRGLAWDPCQCKSSRWVSRSHLGPSSLSPQLLGGTEVWS